MTTTARSFIGQFRDDVRSLGSRASEYRLRENREMIYGTLLVLGLGLVGLLASGVLRPLALVILLVLFSMTVLRVEDDDYSNSPFWRGVGRGMLMISIALMFFVGVEWLALDGSF